MRSSATVKEVWSPGRPMLVIGAPTPVQPAFRTSLDIGLLFVLLAITITPVFALITVIALIVLFSVSD